MRLPEAVPVDWAPPTYRLILLPLDHSDRDPETVVHAAALARAHGSKLHLLHIEEDVTSQIYGTLASTAEVESGRRYFEDLAERLRRQGIDVELSITPGRNPRDVIVRWARQNHPDLIVMGAHGHGRIKDLIFGRTIDAVRHAVGVPILVVRRERK